MGHLSMAGYDRWGSLQPIDLRLCQLLRPRRPRKPIAPLSRHILSRLRTGKAHPGRGWTRNRTRRQVHQGRCGVQHVSHGRCHSARSIPRIPRTACDEERMDRCGKPMPATNGFYNALSGCMNAAYNRPRYPCFHELEWTGGQILQQFWNGDRNLHDTLSLLRPPSMRTNSQHDRKTSIAP